MNTFGRNFCITTFGESHGAAIGVIIDGCPPGTPLAESDIQPFLDRRRPGTSPLVSARQETDTVSILSGIFEGTTTGTPVALVVKNEDEQTKDYEELRPSSARAMPTSPTSRSTVSGTTGEGAGFRAGDGRARGCRRGCHEIPWQQGDPD